MAQRSMRRLIATTKSTLDTSSTNIEITNWFNSTFEGNNSGEIGQKHTTTLTQSQNDLNLSISNETIQEFKILILGLMGSVSLLILVIIIISCICCYCLFIKQKDEHTTVPTTELTDSTPHGHQYQNAAPQKKRSVVSMSMNNSWTPYSSPLSHICDIPIQCPVINPGPGASPRYMVDIERLPSLPLDMESDENHETNGCYDVTDALYDQGDTMSLKRYHKRNETMTTDTHTEFV
eukprot:98390_1